MLALPRYGLDQLARTRSNSGFSASVYVILIFTRFPLFLSNLQGSLLASQATAFRAVPCAILTHRIGQDTPRKVLIMPFHYVSDFGNNMFNIRLYAAFNFDCFHNLTFPF